jgi:hypothetical protein
MHEGAVRRLWQGNKLVETKLAEQMNSVWAVVCIAWWPATRFDTFISRAACAGTR